MDNANIELIRGHMDTIILRTLLSGAKYGLEILNEIRDSSQELYTLKQPTLYNSLKRLEKLGYITSMPGASSNGAKRVYYELSDSGKDFVVEDQRQWEFSRTIIDKLVSDRVFDPAINDKPFEPSEFRPSTKRSSKSDIAQNNDSIAATAPINNNTINNSNKYDISQQPIMVAKSSNSDNADLTKFQFTPEIVDKNIVELVTEDLPLAVEALYDEKWEKKSTNVYGYTTDYVPNKAVGSNQPKSEFASYSDRISTKSSSLSNEEKIAAATALYSKETIVKENASTLSGNLTHYDLEVPKQSKRVVDPIAVENFYKITAESNNITNSKSDANSDKMPNTANGKFSFDIWDGKHSKVAPVDQKPADINSKTYKKTEPIPVVETNNSEVNYISTFENIFNAKPAKEFVENKVKEKKADLYHYESENTAVKAVSPIKMTQNNSQPDYDEDMNFAKLKHSLAGDGITLKQYVKSNTSAYYVNKYYYFSKLIRDWSLIAYAIYALFCIVAFFPSKSAINGSIGVFLGFLFGGAVLPIAATIYWGINPTNRRPTVFNLAHTMITGLIIMLGMLMCILLIGFFGVRANVADVKTMLAPIILPLISLILIPIFITVYAMLYNSKKYHIR